MQNYYHTTPHHTTVSSSLLKTSSPKLLIAAISAVLSASVVAVVLVFLYYRRLKNSRRYNDEKTHSTSYRSDHNNNIVYATRSDSSRRNIHSNTTTTTNTRKVSVSSEFLYLGTVVNNSRNGLDHHHSSISSSSDDDDDVDVDVDDGYSGNETDHVHYNHKKLDSPDLQPLPPLNFNANVNANANNVFVEEEQQTEEEEEFYSPRGSIGTGSSSHRLFAAAAIPVDCNEDESSSCSCTSSARSKSDSISPSVSVVSPLISELKSPQLTQVQIPGGRNVLSSFVSSPDRTTVEPSPARVSDPWYGNVKSPSLSMASTSPDRNVTKVLGLDSSNVLNWNHVKSVSVSPQRELEKNHVDSPTFTSASSSPERDLHNDQVKSPCLSPIFTSPPRNGLEKDHVSSPTFSLTSILSPERDLDKDLEKSPTLSSNSVSPERSLHHLSSGESPRLSNDSSDRSRRAPSPHSSSSSSPERILGLKDESSPGVLVEKSQSPAKLNSPIVSPPPPPRPPRRHWELPHRNPSAPSSSGSSPDREKILKDASPQRMSKDHDLTSSAPPPPPPPPPPLDVSRHRRQWEVPNPSPPTSADQSSVALPPPLTPPSRPFVMQSTNLPPNSTCVDNVDEEAAKPKLKPLHWDKVRASSDREMVWDHLRSSSFKLNEEMIETLFVVNNSTPKPTQTTPRPVFPSSNQEDRVLDPKKSQNIAISLRALNVTIEEVCEALSEAVLDVPFAFKRVDAMLYIANFDSEMEYLKKSFETLEAACEELRNSRMFLKLLEAVLKTGNRMNVGTNRGDAQAFKLDTLLKLVDVKGADGKTTLLHFVVQEIIRMEGARLSNSNQSTNPSLNEDARCRKLGLQVVSGLSSDLSNVKKAAAMDSDVLNSEVSKLSKGIENISAVVKLNETTGLDENSRQFTESMNDFMKKAEEEIIRIQAQESVALSLVKEITEYFHGNSAKEEAHPFRIFLVVKDFLNVLDRVCKEVGMINERTLVSSAHKFPVPVNPMGQSFPVPVNPMMPQVFSGFPGRQQSISCDDES
ncbi:hypothetical protein ACFE04_030635 [Oxalis oulophora]